MYRSIKQAEAQKAGVTSEADPNACGDASQDSSIIASQRQVDAGDPKTVSAPSRPSASRAVSIVSQKRSNTSRSPSKPPADLHPSRSASADLQAGAAQAWGYDDAMEVLDQDGLGEHVQKTREALDNRPVHHRTNSHNPYDARAPAIAADNLESYSDQDLERELREPTRAVSPDSSSSARTSATRSTGPIRLPRYRLPADGHTQYDDESEKMDAEESPLAPLAHPASSWTPRLAQGTRSNTIRYQDLPDHSLNIAQHRNIGIASTVQATAANPSRQAQALTFRQYSPPRGTLPLPTAYPGHSPDVEEDTLSSINGDDPEESNLPAQHDSPVLPPTGCIPESRLREEEEEVEEAMEDDENLPPPQNTRAQTSKPPRRSATSGYVQPSFAPAISPRARGSFKTYSNKAGIKRPLSAATSGEAKKARSVGVGQRATSGKTVETAIDLSD